MCTSTGSHTTAWCYPRYRIHLTTFLKGGGHTHIIPYRAARDRNSIHQTFDKKRLWVVRGQGVHLPLWHREGTLLLVGRAERRGMGFLQTDHNTHICVLRKGHLRRHSKEGGARLRIENVIRPLCLALLAVKVHGALPIPIAGYRRLVPSIMLFHVQIPCVSRPSG